MIDKESDEYKVGFHDGYQAALKQIARVCPDVLLKEEPDVEKQTEV